MKGHEGVRWQNYSCEPTIEECLKVTAVCDPDEKVRNLFRDKHNIKDEMCFKSYDEFFKLGKVADLAIVATMDDLHLDPTLKAIELGLK